VKRVFALIILSCLIQAVAQAAPDLIAFVRCYPPDSARQVHPQGDIYTIRADGRQIKRLTFSGHNADPAWTPDGKRLVYVSRGQVWIINSDGSRPRALSRLAKWQCHAPQVSHDGKRIVFNAENVVSAVDVRDALWVMNLNGSGLKRVAVAGDELRHPTWTRDGRGIIYQDGSELEWGTSSIRQVSSHGGRPKVLYGYGKTKTFYDIMETTLSPDGKRLAGISFGIAGTFTSQNRIVTLNANGSGVREIAELPDDVQFSGPDWSPDGRQLVFVSDKTLEIVDVATRRRRAIFSSAGCASPAWRPTPR
jgi:TolB protein